MMSAGGIASAGQRAAPTATSSLGARAMFHVSNRSAAVCAALVVVALAAPWAGAEERVVMSYPRFTPEPPHRITAVDQGRGEALVEPIQLADGPGFLAVTEGPALLLVPTAGGTGLDQAVRVEVAEVLDGGRARITFPRAASEVVARGPALLGRPFAGDITAGGPAPVPTKVIRGLPDVVKQAGPGGDPARGAAADRARAAAQGRRSMNNLKQICLAFHNYADANRSFPPAVVFGPDGKPWHSWRVLLLPYLEQAELYQQYDFSQPWDSPDNAKLAARIVDVYRDPARKADDPAAGYAVLVGPEALFSPDGARMKSKDDFPACLTRGRRPFFQDVTDGTSSTIAFVTVPAERTIPWTKPEDIVFDERFPGIGKPTGIGAVDAGVGAGRVALAAFADGSVHVLAADKDPAELRKLVTRAGGELIEYDAIDARGARIANPSGPPLVKIVVGDDGAYRLEVE